MRVFKKTLAVALALLMGLTGLYPAMQQVWAADFILEPAALSGADYTDSDQLAAALDEVFSGDIGIYSDAQHTLEVSMPVGTYMNNDTLYYVKSQTSGNSIAGWQCYIYGNAVYNKLFREWVGHANGFAHSKLAVPGGADTVSYELFQEAEIRCGAYFRTTGNSDGSYSSNVGHSMIVLAYDSENITYLEGNGDGNGLVRVAIRSWSDFNLRQLSGRGRYIAHIVQPADEIYDTLYPACPHQYDQLGVCTTCGSAYDWRSTADTWAWGIYKLTEKVTPRADAPYSGATASEVTLLKNQQIYTTGQYRNAFDQVWYSAVDDAGNTFYINGASLKFVSIPTLEATCTGFSPEDGAKLEQKSYPVKGVVTSNFPLKSISGYLDGELYATWTAGNETTTQVDLRQTDINNKLYFSKMEGGRHKVTLVAETFFNTEPVTVHESTFFTISTQPCNHRYTSTVTQDATCTENGVLTYTCQNCQDEYTRTVVAPGHDYQGGTCTFCHEQQIMAQLSGIVLAAGDRSIPVQITLQQEGKEVYTTTVTDGAYHIPDILPGDYLLTVSKTDCPAMIAELALTPGAAVIDVRLFQYGDVTGDGNLNIGDLSRLYAHIRHTNPLQDPYALLCADYRQDDAINIGDVVKLYALFRKT